MTNKGLHLFTEEEIRQIKEDCRIHFMEGLEDNNENNYELLPPYSEKEISEFEDQIGEALEPSLRFYLLNISRQIMGNQYPRLFRVHKDFNLKTCLIPEDVRYWIYKRYDPTHRFGDGMVCIGSGGCSNVDMIVLRGNNLGSVWLGYGDGPSVHGKQSFKEYVLNHSSWWE